MKKYIYSTFFIINLSLAQVGIGTSTPNSNAALEISSTNKGMLLPEYSLTSLFISIKTGTTPSNGLLIYNNTNSPGIPKGIYYWMDDRWVRLNIYNETNQILSLTKIADSFVIPSTSLTNNEVTWNNTTVNTINGASLSISDNKTITLPAGKYLINVGADIMINRNAATVSVSSPSNSLFGGNHSSFDSYFIDASTNAVLTQKINEEVICNSTIAFGTFDHIHTLELASTTTIKYKFEHNINSRHQFYIKTRDTFFINIIKLE